MLCNGRPTKPVMKVTLTPWRLDQVLLPGLLRHLCTKLLLRCYYLRCYYQHVSTCLKLLLSACINMYQHVLNFRFELTFWGSAASPLQSSATCVRASECASKGSSASKCICWLHLGPTRDMSASPLDCITCLHTHKTDCPSLKSIVPEAEQVIGTWQEHLAGMPINFRYCYYY